MTILQAFRVWQVVLDVHDGVGSHPVQHRRAFRNRCRPVGVRNVQLGKARVAYRHDVVRPEPPADIAFARGQIAHKEVLVPLLLRQFLVAEGQGERVIGVCLRNVACLPLSVHLPEVWVADRRLENNLLEHGHRDDPGSGGHRFVHLLPEC
ncbi:hypothetical protein D3C77_588330 [compost metagenome]